MAGRWSHPARPGSAAAAVGWRVWLRRRTPLNAQAGSSGARFPRDARVGRDMSVSVPVRTKRLKREQRRACPDVGTFDGNRCELLAQLVYPLSTAAFLKRHWRKCALAVHGGRQRFAALIRERLHGLSVAKLLADSPSEEIHVWFRTAAGNESMKTPDREAALTCHRAGGSLYFRAPADASELLVTALSQQLGLSFGALYPDGAPRGEVHPSTHPPTPTPHHHHTSAATHHHHHHQVETFVSREGHVTDWHFDFMENFTLQLKGTKRWRLKRGAVEVPVRGCTPQWSGRTSAAVRGAAEEQAKVHTQHASAPFDEAPPAEWFADAAVVTLTPGSVLYVPAGMWHRVESEEDSVSMNVSLMGLLWADLVADAVRQRLLSYPAARAPVCMRSVADGRRQLRDLLAIARQEVQQLSPAFLLPRAAALPRVARRPLPPAADGARAARAVRSGTRFERNPLAVVVRLRDEEGEEGEEGEGGEGRGEGGEGAAAALGSARPSSPIARNDGQASASASSDASAEQPPDADSGPGVAPGVARAGQADPGLTATRAGQADRDGYPEHAERAERPHLQEARSSSSSSISSSSISSSSGGGGGGGSGGGSGSSTSSSSSRSSVQEPRGVEAIAVDDTAVRPGAGRLGGAASASASPSASASTSAARVPFVSALLLAAVGLTTVSAAMLSLYKGGPVGTQVGLAEAVELGGRISSDREAPASSAAAELDRLRAAYVPPPYQLFSSPSFEDYRPLGAPPPARWKVRL